MGPHCTGFVVSAVVAVLTLVGSGVATDRLPEGRCCADRAGDRRLQDTTGRCVGRPKGRSGKGVQDVALRLLVS